MASPPAAGVGTEAALTGEAPGNPQVPNRSPDSAQWVGLQSRGEKSRGEALDALGQALASHLQGAPCPLQNGRPEAKALELPWILVLLLRLSGSCPFQDIRERCAQMLQAAQVRKAPPGWRARLDAA